MTEYPSEPPREKARSGQLSIVKHGETKYFSADGYDEVTKKRMGINFSIRCLNPNGTVEISANKFEKPDNTTVDAGTSVHAAGDMVKILYSIPLRITSVGGAARVEFL